MFAAGTLRDALRAEEVLNGAGVHYVVQVELLGTSFFFSRRHGAVFYVASGQAAFCRARLAAEGLRRGVVEDQGQEGT